MENSDINSYLRLTGIKKWFSREPYIIHSRKVPELFHKINQDSAPILAEGIHAAGFFPDWKKSQPERKLYIRVHNIESNYYKELYKNEKNHQKKIYFYSEYLKLKNKEYYYLRFADALLTLSEAEHKILSSEFNSIWIPAFIPDFRQEPVYNQNLASVLLFHGNFSVNENFLSAKFLINKLVPHLPENTVLMLAGKSADVWKSFATKNLIICSDPSPEEMNKIIDNADAFILPIRQKTGVKLKTLISLSTSKITFTTPEGIIGTGLEQEVKDLGWIFNTDQEMIELILKHAKNHFQPPKESDNLARKLFQIYNNDKNAEKIRNIVLSESF